ncbi:helix-turn-helix domain-containing protein [Zhouia sp. PK063]|uniref:helix-turn-helix domain-containing protein n=1 Tax=Zhouia sp. PK063 TaxID=3373602 RepID=UPI003788A9F6
MRTIADDTATNILREQFVPDNVFIYVAKGAIRVFDGNKTYTYTKGDACLARKNRLAKYELLDSDEDFFPILFCFEEAFLQQFQQKKQIALCEYRSTDSFINISDNDVIDSFIQSIKPYYKGVMQLDRAFEEVKYEELLIILLKIKPDLAGVLFDYRKPGKIDLEEFMNQHYKFNTSISNFAHLTGRSLSAFKRDFKTIFKETPNRWLVNRRLKEAHFLIKRERLKPTDIYIDLGFESLSHFSVAFKKKYGYTPTALSNEWYLK